MGPTLTWLLRVGGCEGGSVGVVVAKSLDSRQFRVALNARGFLIDEVKAISDDSPQNDRRSNDQGEFSQHQIDRWNETERNH